MSNVISVNGFAENPPPQAIDTNRARCAWGIGLAIPRSGTGTAFIIGNRREVMANLHVVDKFCRGNRRFTFSHGFDGRAGLSTIGATVVARGDYCSNLRRGRHDYGGDWVVAVLDEDPLAVEETAPGANFSPLQPRGDGAWLRDNGRYVLLGYGMSFRAGMQPYRSAPCRFGRLFEPGVVEHDCDASARTSGAPIVSLDPRGHCLVAALHVGEIETLPGRPAYRDDLDANVAVLAGRFAATVRAVARELERGRDTAAIIAELARRPPR
ncbi:MAG: hypothetical protein ACREFC_06230 [Stellaceae bacterium]